MKRLDRLEIARGFAALLIVFYHATAVIQTPKYFGAPPFGAFFSIGGFGVDFFFALSGFILFWVHRKDLGQPRRLKSYVLRRLIRIYPPYWVALLLVIGVYLIRPAFGGGDELQPALLLTSVFLLPHSQAPVLGVAWSLRHEVMFYAVFALLLLRPRWGWRIFVGWQCAIIALNLHLVPAHYLLAQVLDVRNLDFGLGMLAVMVVGAAGIRRANLACWGGTAAMFALGYAAQLGVLVIPYRLLSVCFGLCSLAILSGVASTDLQAAKRPPKLLRLLGEASYSIYLVHYPLLSAIAKVAAGARLQRWLSPEGLFVLFSALATAGGIAFHLAVEKPLLGYCQRRFLPERGSPSRSDGLPQPAPSAHS